MPAAKIDPAVKKARDRLRQEREANAAAKKATAREEAEAAFDIPRPVGKTKPPVNPPDKRKKTPIISEAKRKAQVSRAELKGLIRENNRELPHVFLFRVSNGEKIKHAGKWITPSFDIRLQAAKDVAPYFAPRLSSIEVIRGISDADIDRVIAGLAAEAGISLGAGGEGETPSGEITGLPAEPAALRSARVGRTLESGDESGASIQPAT